MDLNKDLNKIDPALELMGEFSKLTCGTVAHINKMRQDAIFSDGAVPAKHKALGAVLWAISARCEPCIKYYVQQTIKHGTNEREIGEYLAVASTMGGCVGEMWALKAFKAYMDASSGTAPAANEPSCCR